MTVKVSKEELADTLPAVCPRVCYFVRTVQYNILPVYTSELVS